MGREVRMVPKNWKHPKRRNGYYQPMFDRPYEPEAKKWLENCILWSKGEHPDQKNLDGAKECKYYWDWDGEPPDKEYYVPVWGNEERTHFQMYENVSEGTPISPPMETREDLARWLADNNASAGACRTANYNQWLTMIKQGFSCSTVVCNGKVMSGVEAASEIKGE